MDQQLLRACKPLVVNESWHDLERLITEYIAAETQVLMNSTEIGAMRESQGKIKAYKNLLSLPIALKSLNK